MQQMPHHWNAFVTNLSSRQHSLLRASGISVQAVLATLYDHYQSQGNQAAHDPVGKIVANAVMALPQVDRSQFVDLFDVVFGVGAYASIVQDWTLHA